MRKIHGTISDIKVKKDGTVYVKILDDKGDYVGGSNKYAKHSSESKKDYPIDRITGKVLKFDEDSPAAIKAEKDYAAVIGSSDNRIVSSNKYGNFIVGDTVFTAHPEKIRMGGVFKMNGLMTSTMPSTIISPIPTLVLDIPFINMLSNLSNISSELLSMMES